jgi:hypothetical protein
MKSLRNALNSMNALHVKKLTYARIITSQIYRLHGLVPNPCEICYFIGLYYLNMNVVHYLNSEVVCTIFMCKQNEKTYNICV